MRADDVPVRLLYGPALADVLIPLLIVVQILFHGVLDDLHPLGGGLQLLLGKTVAPQGKLQHFGCDLLQPLIHGLGHRQHILRQAPFLGIKVPKAVSLS